VPNNDAGRVLRHAVLWCKSSGGTDSEAGSRFVERMLSVVATCRQQNRNVLDLLTACCRARLDGSAAPSLLPAEAELAASQEIWDFLGGKKAVATPAICAMLRIVPFGYRLPGVGRA